MKQKHEEEAPRHAKKKQKNGGNGGNGMGGETRSSLGRFEEVHGNNHDKNEEDAETQEDAEE